MSEALIAALGRQHSLERELAVVSNNIANANTVGFKADRAIFAEYLNPAGIDQPSLSLGALGAHDFDLSAGSLNVTGGPFDLAIQGEGFFEVETPLGNRVTRAGNFQLSSEGVLIDANGNSVLSSGGGPITIPGQASDIRITAEGSVLADGVEVERISIVVPGGDIRRDTSTYFISDEPTVPAFTGRVLQGALEQSNVSTVTEIARLIEVQRAYEAGQSMLQREDDRLTQLITIVRDR
ncbi:MAG: flagellar basal-body rod protein FlgF [Pseudomonadota bacterium]